MGITAQADVVDHVIPHKGDQQLFWDRANWQSACQWHHDVVKQRLEDMYEAGALPARALSLKSEKAKEFSKNLNPRGGI